MGTKYAVDAMVEMYGWDLAGRAGQIDMRGFQVEVNEFDYTGVNQVLYEENGVTIRSWPAIHAIDGPVSFSLEWNDLKFVFSSDSYPNQWFIDYGRDADLAIHECFVAVPTLVSKMGFPPETALQVGTQIHTAPEATGDLRAHPNDLRRPAQPGRGLHGVERHQRRNPGSHGGGRGAHVGAAQRNTAEPA
jgi:ribonuclease Z